MSKKKLEINSNKIENNSSEIESAKNLCVYELRRRLKNKQRKENINKATILLIIIFIIFFFQ